MSDGVSVWVSSDLLEVARVGVQLDGDVLAGAADELADLPEVVLHVAGALHRVGVDLALELLEDLVVALAHDVCEHVEAPAVGHADHRAVEVVVGRRLRSEEHTSELQSLMRISYAVFCLKKKKSNTSIILH